MGAIIFWSGTSIILTMAALITKWEWMPYPTGAAWGVLTTILFTFSTVDMSSRLRFWDLLRLKTIYRNRRIRLSISGLIRIRDGNDYLLVKSQRIKDQYQPVGGVMQYFPSAESMLQSFKADFNPGYGHDKDLVNDLRLAVPGRMVSKLLHWYWKSVDREQTPWREFYEELIDTKILSSNDFPWLQFRRTAIHIEKLHWSEHFAMPEILVAEVFEPVLTEAQKTIITKLHDQNPQDYCRWFDRETIGRLGHNHRNTQTEVRIGSHTKWTLEGNNANN